MLTVFAVQNTNDKYLVHSPLLSPLGNGFCGENEKWQTKNSAVFAVVASTIEDHASPYKLQIPVCKLYKHSVRTRRPLATFSS